MHQEPNRRPNTLCLLCSRPIYRRPYQLKVGQRTCSRACRNRVYLNVGKRGPNPKLQGANNPAWKGGVTFWRKKGNYKPIKYVRCPSAFLPMARKDGYIMEHRLLVATREGRLLARTEVVHHINHDPHDNRLENLMLFPSNREHKIYEWSAKGAARLRAEKALGLL